MGFWQRARTLARDNRILNRRSVLPVTQEPAHTDVIPQIQIEPFDAANLNARGVVLDEDRMGRTPQNNLPLKADTVVLVKFGRVAAEHPDGALRIRLATRTHDTDKFRIRDKDLMANRLAPFVEQNPKCAGY